MTRYLSKECCLLRLYVSTVGQQPLAFNEVAGIQSNRNWVTEQGMSHDGHSLITNLVFYRHYKINAFIPRSDTCRWNIRISNLQVRYSDLTKRLVNILVTQGCQDDLAYWHSSILPVWPKVIGPVSLNPSIVSNAVNADSRMTVTRLCSPLSTGNVAVITGRLSPMGVHVVEGGMPRRRPKCMAYHTECVLGYFFAVGLCMISGSNFVWLIYH